MSNPNFLLTQAIFAIQMANSQAEIKLNTSADRSNAPRFFDDQRSNATKYSNKPHKNNKLKPVGQPRRHNHR